MRVGLSLSSSLQSADPSVAASWMIERARAANRVELDSLSVGDHHAMAISYYQNTPMLGRLMAEWGERPVGCLFLLPLWNPVLVAEHVGTLASLTSAPFVVQTGIGHGRDQFAAMNADHRTRGSILEESVRVIKALLGGDDVESELVGGPVSLGLRPRQEVQWWIGGGPSARAIDRAGRIGDAWYASPALTPRTAAPELALYNAACERAGAVPQPIVRKDVIVSGEPGRANRLGEQILAAGYRGMDRESLLIGTPAEVAAELRRFADLGFVEVVCRCMTVPQAAALESIELLAEVRSLLD